jgi:hypothetical protein
VIRIAPRPVAGNGAESGKALKKVKGAGSCPLIFLPATGYYRVVVSNGEICYSERAFIISGKKEAVMKRDSIIFHTIYLLAGIALVFTLVGCTLAPTPPAGAENADSLADDQLEPNPELSPGQVVKIQVEALQNNDEADTGIEITFKFASPANKRVTGPLNRFKRLVKNPLYRPMLNHKIAEYEPVEISGNTATQRVTIIGPNGKATVYLFSLSRQTEPPCIGCWLTDSVTVVPVKRQELQGI